MNNEGEKYLIITSALVWNLTYSLWGYDNEIRRSVVIEMQPSIYNEALQAVIAADHVLGMNTTNPGLYGVIPFIALGPGEYSISSYEGYTEFIINSTDLIGVFIKPLYGNGHAAVDYLVNK